MNVPESKAIRKILGPAAFIYGIGASLKMQLYDQKIFTPVKLPVPVVSIGNITVGGTGKTPITIDLANRLTAQGKKVGILSRGYKRKSSADQVVVSDGKQILASCEDSGDEPYLMALSCKNAVVISGASRVDTGRTAIESYGCDILLLDDGFQHVKLDRERNIVLIDYADSLDEEAVLPAGRLREPLAGLKRATEIIITKVPEQADELHLGKLRKAVTGSLEETNSGPPEFFYSRFKPSLLRNTYEELTLDSLAGAKVISLSGIARPESFHGMVRDLGFQIVDKLTYEDHHWFDQSDRDKLEKSLEENEAAFVLTTEKDLVRLNLKEELARRTFAIALSTEWIGRMPDFSGLDKPGEDTAETKNA